MVKTASGQSYNFQTYDISPQNDITSTVPFNGRECTGPPSWEAEPSGRETTANNSISMNPPFTTSTTFYPGALINRDIRTLDTDLIIISIDLVRFYVQTPRLLSASTNNFNGLLPSKVKDAENGSSCDALVHLSESSAVLDIILHAIYRLRFTSKSSTPNFPDIVSAFATFSKYGLSVEHYVKKFSPLHKVLSTHILSSPLDVYALAASNDLEELAVETSAHLLSLRPSSITDEHALQIGPIYLRRLFSLHLRRNEALKNLLLRPPEKHMPTRKCNYDQQSNLIRAWALAAASVAMIANPDLATTEIEAITRSAQDELSCYLCKAAFTNCLRELLSDWSNIEASPSLA